MRIFHLSDLHIGIRLYDHDLREEQEHIFRQIVGLVAQYQPDAVAIAGDIYDRPVPSVESVQLFDQFVKDLYYACDKAHIMMIGGNHDSAQRIDSFRWVLAEQRIHMVGLPPRRPEEYIESVTLHDAHGPVHFYLLPFCKPSVIKGVFGSADTSYSYDKALRMLFEREQIDLGARNVLVSHQFYLPSGRRAEDIERMDSEIAAVGDIDVAGSDILGPFEYAALGHIHKPMTVGEDRFRYCGTPLAYSVSEAGQEKGVLMAELGKKGDPVTVTKLPLSPLHRVRVIKDKFENVLRQASEDHVQIILTDTEDLEVCDLQERLRTAFPNLLEIRREHVRAMELDETALEHMIDDPYALICSFIPDMDEEEQAIMQAVINEAKEGMTV